MVTLTWEKINNPTFAGALKKLVNLPGLEQKTAYRVGKLWDACADQLEMAREKDEEIRQKYQKLVQEEGKPDSHEFIGPEEKKAYEAEFNALMQNNSFEVKIHKLDFNQVKSLSGAELLAIESLLDNLPEA